MKKVVRKKVRKGFLGVNNEPLLRNIGLVVEDTGGGLRGESVERGSSQS